MKYNDFDMAIQMRMETGKGCYAVNLICIVHSKICPSEKSTGTG